MKMFLKNTAIISVALIGIAVPQHSSGQTPPRSHVRARDAIQRAHQAANEDAEHAAYAQINENSIENDADVRAIYNELVSMHNAFGKKGARTKRDSKLLADVLASCRQPAHHVVIAQLLDQEYAGMTSNYLGPWGAKTDAEESKEAIRFERFNALTVAAGEGKNEVALPTLRRLRKKGGVAGKVAEDAIVRIGKEQDFEELYQDSIEDPSARIDLSPFGPKILDRVMRDINDPGFPKNKKKIIIGHLPRIADKALMPKYMTLLSNNNPEVVSVAARRIAESLTLNEEQTIRQLLADPRSSVHGPVLRAIGRMNGDQAKVLLLKTLAQDRDENQRAYAAAALGSRPGSDTESALRAALKSDSSEIVKDSAGAALARIKGISN